MEVQVENLSPVEKKLTIRIPAERVQKELDDAYRTLQREVALPGFRRGKVPRRFLETRFGHHVKGEVGSKLISEGFEKATQDTGVVPVGQPLIEKGEIRAGEPYEFSVRVEVRPEVEVSDYVGLEVPFDRVEVTDEEVQKELERARRQAGQMTAVTEERPVAEGDLVAIDFTLRAEGEPELSQEDYLLASADPQYGVLYPLVIGKSVGEEATGQVTVPEGHHQRNLAGREVEARVVVRGIKALTFPELDDALAKEYGHESLEAWKAAVRFEIEQAKERRARDKAGHNLVQQLIDRHPIEVPPGLLRSQAEQMIRNTTLHLQSQGVRVRHLNLDDFDPDNRQRVLDEAAFAIRRALILEAVADKEGIEVTDEDLDARIREIAEQNRQRPEAIRGILVKNQAIDDLKARIREEKALDFLLERANIVEQEPEPAGGSESPAEEPLSSEGGEAGTPSQA